MVLFAYQPQTSFALAATGAGRTSVRSVRLAGSAKRLVRFPFAASRVTVHANDPTGAYTPSSATLRLFNGDSVDCR